MKPVPAVRVSGEGVVEVMEVIEAVKENLVEAGKHTVAAREDIAVEVKKDLAEVQDGGDNRQRVKEEEEMNLVYHSEQDIEDFKLVNPQEDWNG